MSDDLKRVVGKDPGISFSLSKRGLGGGRLQPTKKAVLVLYISKRLKKEIDMWQSNPAHKIEITEMDVLPISFAPRVVEEAGASAEATAIATATTSGSKDDLEDEDFLETDGEKDDGGI